MPTPYSPGLLAFVSSSYGNDSFGANLSNVAEHNDSLGIRDGSEFFLLRSYALPSQEHMDAYVDSLDITDEERESYRVSRLSAFLRRTGMRYDREGSIAADATMKVLIALHLEFGEELWNRSSFPHSNGRQLVELGVGDDRYLDWAVNDQGELTTFGLSVMLLRSKGWIDAMLVASTDNRNSIPISELAFAASRRTDCFASLELDYGHRSRAGFYHLVALSSIRSHVTDNSAVAWILLWSEMNPALGGYRSTAEIEEQDRKWDIFLNTIADIRGRVSFDDALPFARTSIRHNAEMIVNAVASDIDPEIIGIISEDEMELAG